MPDVIAADGIAVFVGNIGMLQRAVVARVLIVIEDDVAIEVFHVGSSTASLRMLLLHLARLRFNA